LLLVHYKFITSFTVLRHTAIVFLTAHHCQV